MSRYASLSDLASRNPGYVSLYIAAVECCSNAAGEVDEAVVMNAVEQARNSVSQIQSATSIMDTLVRHGALMRTVLVDGVPYGSDLKDVQADDSVPEDAEVKIVYTVTEAGIEFARLFRSSDMIEGLFAERGVDAKGFVCVLSACTDEGKSTDELQVLLREEGLLNPDERGIEQVHASYFTGALERVGALTWEKGHWKTTEDGRRAIA